MNPRSSTSMCEKVQQIKGMSTTLYRTFKLLLYLCQQQKCTVVWPKTCMLDGFLSFLFIHQYSWILVPYLFYFRVTPGIFGEDSQTPLYFAVLVNSSEFCPIEFQLQSFPLSKQLENSLNCIHSSKERVPLVPVALKKSGSLAAR